MNVSSTSCVHGYSPFLRSFNSQPKQHHSLRVNDKLLWLSNTKTTTTTTLVLQSSQRLASLKTNAVPAPESLLVVVTSTGKSADITVFLQTSAGLLFLYWVTNFVVPDFISKKFGFDKVNEDQKKK